MDSFMLSGFDIGLGLLLLTFALIGLWRGFTSDFLGLFTWFGAILATSLLYPYLHEYAREYISVPYLADSATVFGIFLISLIILVYIVKSISAAVKKSMLGGLDRSMGIVSGLFRGTVILTGVYLIALMYWKPGQKPDWVTNSKFEGYLTCSARLAQKYLLPDDLIPGKVLDHLSGEFDKQLQRNAEDIVKNLSAPKPAGRKDSKKEPKKELNKEAPKKESSGYQDKERDSLDALIKGQ